MRSILRSELYRLKCQKSTWILLLVTFALVLWVSVSLGMILGNAPFVQYFYDSVEETYSAYGLENPMTELRASVNMEVSSRLEFMSLTMTRELAILMAVFAAVFSIRKRTSGFVFNTVSRDNRGKNLFAEGLILFFYAVLLLAAASLASFLPSLLFFRDFPLGNISKFLLYLLLEALLLLVIALFATTWCASGRGKRNRRTFWMVFYISAGSSIVYSFVDSLIGWLTGTSFYVEYILPIGALELLSYGKADTYMAAALVFILFLAVWWLVQHRLWKKKDVI